MEDEILGKLEYDYGYEKEEELEFFGKTYKIRVALESYDKTISNEQRNAYVKFKNDYEEVIQKLPKVLLEYYLKIYDGFIDGIIDVPEKIDKEHVNEEIVVKTIKPQTLYLAKDGRYALLCRCLWDEEHGTAIFFNGKEVSMGEQDEII